MGKARTRPHQACSPTLSTLALTRSCCLRGEVDLSTTPGLERTLGVIPSERSVVVDCAGVDFVDSAGLRAFVHEFQRHRDAGGVFSLRHPSVMLHHMLVRTGLTTLLELPTV